MSDKSVHGRSGAAFTKDREKWLSPKGTQKRTTTLNRFQYLVQRKHLFLHPSFGQCVFHCRCLITFFSSSSLLSSTVCSIRMEGRMKKKNGVSFDFHSRRETVHCLRSTNYKIECIVFILALPSMTFVNAVVVRSEHLRFENVHVY